MASANDISKDVFIRVRDDVFQVVEFQHVNPGKGAAFVRTRIKSLRTGKVLEQTFKDSDTVDLVDVERRRMQFLYGDASGFHFMDNANYEQVDLNTKMVGDRAGFLKEGQEVAVIIFEGAPLSIELPKKITLTVTEAPPGIRGDTAGGKVTKEVTLETGMKTRAPLFINEGDRVVLNTETGEYVERA